MKFTFIKTTTPYHVTSKSIEYPNWSETSIHQHWIWCKNSMNHSVFKIRLYIYSENWGHLNYSQIQNKSHTKHTQSYIVSLNNHIISFNWLCYLWKLFKGMITISYHILSHPSLSFFLSHHCIFVSKKHILLCAFVRMGFEIIADQNDWWKIQKLDR